jgi:hypothetical protein
MIHLAVHCETNVSMFSSNRPVEISNVLHVLGADKFFVVLRIPEGAGSGTSIGGTGNDR